MRRTAMRLITAIAVGIGGCKNTVGPAPPPAPPPPPPPPGPIATVAVSPSQVTIPVGSTALLSATARDANGTVIATTFTWASSDTIIATVSSSGQVSAVAAGSAVVTASAAGQSGNASIQVAPPITNEPHADLATYFGGSADEMIRDVAFDGQGNLYVAGATKSSNFPTKGNVVDRSFNGNSDAFIAKIDRAGNLVWATVLGGPNFDRAYALEVDEQGFIYVAGRAGAGFPTTAGSVQPNFGGGPTGGPYGPQDGFACKLEPDAVRVVFCTYIGSSDEHMIRDVAIDAQHALYLATATDQATPLPAAWFANAAQKTIKGAADGTIVKLAPDGSRVVWATYLGGSADELGDASVRVSPAGAATAYYSTYSSDAPTPNGFQKSYGGNLDVYIARLAIDGGSFTWASYLGGGGTEGTETHGLALDPAGNVYAIGGTRSANFPTTASAVQRTYGGSNSQGSGDGFVALIANDGSHIVSATYLGGSGGDLLEGVALDAVGNVYISGRTTSTGLATTAGAFQRTNGGGFDACVAVLTPNLDQIKYLTYFGGPGEDWGRAVAVSSTGQFAAGGSIGSSNVTTISPFQASLGGAFDSFITRFIP